MDPNTQPSQPTQEPSMDTVPDAKEPDTGAQTMSNPSMTTPPEAIPSVPPTTAPAMGDTTATNSPLPSNNGVVNPTTPATPAMSVGSAPAKKGTRTILVVVLIVVALAAAGVVFYVTTL